MKKNRIEWLDIAKGIAIVCVIIGHTLNTNSPIRHFIFSFHMPLFFILAGYTAKIKTMSSILRASIPRLLIPYLLLSALVVGKDFILSPSGFTTDNLAISFLRVVMGSGYVTPQGIPAVGMAWFLIALFASRILFNALLLLETKFHKSNLITGISCLTFCIIGIICGGRFNLYLPCSLDISFVALFFMWGGRQMNLYGAIEDSDAFIKYDVFAFGLWLVSLGTSSIELTTRMYISPLLALLGGFAGTFVVCRLSLLIQKRAQVLKCLLIFLGKNSFQLYCFHATDWYIPWQQLPLVQSLPLQKGLSAAIRVLYNVIFIELFSSLTVRSSGSR